MLVRLATRFAVGIAAVIGAGCGGTPASAAGPWLHSHVVGPQQLGVSGLGLRLCVVVGGTADNADVQVVRDGVPGHDFAVHGQRAALDAVSCAGRGGCIAVGSSSLSDSVVDVVRIGRSGRPVGLVRVTVPFQVELSGISCTAVSRCALVGWSGQSMVTGWWNGTGVAVRKLSLPHGARFLQDAAVSCWNGGSCAAVATGKRGHVRTGIFVRFGPGRAGQVRLDRGYAFIGVSCFSARLCYAAGYDQHGGVVVALRNGVPSAPRHLVAGMFAIACDRTGCTAAGVRTASPPDQGTTVGVVAVLSAGRVTSTATVPVTAGYLSVARTGRAFVAVGNRPPGSVITSGRRG